METRQDYYAHVGVMPLSADIINGNDCARSSGQWPPSESITHYPAASIIIPASA